VIPRVTLVAAMAALSICQDSVIRKVGEQLPHIKRERQDHIKFISSELDHDINALIYDQADYVTWDY